MTYQVYNTNNNGSSPLLIEKIFSIASYWTGGIVGFIYILIAFITKRSIRPFLRYHVYQSIFISLLLAVLNMLYNLLSPILQLIPFVNTLLFSNVFQNFTIINLLILVTLIYLSAGVLLNKYSYIPWISDVIKYHTGVR